MTKYDWEMISNDGLRDRFGYSLSLFLYTMKVSIPFYVAEVSLDFFCPIFHTRSFYRQSLRGNLEHVFVVNICQ